MKWYDIFSNIYDSSLEKLYYESRKSAVKLLDLKPSQNILDVACGTGANFIHLKNSGREDLHIYGTDNSEGMLRKAQRTIDKHQINNITLFQSDARALSDSLIREKINIDLKFDRVFCVLGFSVIPDWEKVMDNLIQLLIPKGRLVIVDVFAEKRTFNSKLIEIIANADTGRRIWQNLQTKTEDFYLEYMPVKENKVGGKLFVATGIKK